MLCGEVNRHGCTAILGIAAERAPRAGRLVQFARGSVPEEALAPAHPQARAVRRPRRFSGTHPLSLTPLTHQKKFRQLSLLLSLSRRASNSCAI